MGAESGRASWRRWAHAAAKLATRAAGWKKKACSVGSTGPNRSAKRWRVLAHSGQSKIMCGTISMQWGKAWGAGKSERAGEEKRNLIKAYFAVFLFLHLPPAIHLAFDIVPSPDKSLNSGRLCWFTLKERRGSDGGKVH